MKTAKLKTVFASKAVSPESLQAVLWETLQKSRTKKISPKEANVIIGAAKEICNVARLDLQYKILDGQFNQKLLHHVEQPQD